MLGQFWINWKNKKLCGTHWSVTLSEHRHPGRADSLQTVAIKGAPHCGAPPFLPAPPLHCSCAAPNTVMRIVAEPPQSARSSPALTVSTPPQASQRSFPVSASPLCGHQSDSPPCRLAPRPLHRRPLAAGRQDFAGTPPVPMGEKASPFSTSDRKAEMGRALSDPDGPSHCRGNPFEQCTLQNFLSD
jgi:hypothetical protein